MLKQRVITALVLAALVLAALFISNPIFWRILLNAVVLASFYEWLRFCQIVKPLEKIISYLLFGASLYLLQFGFADISAVIPLICLLWVVLLAFTMFETLDIIHHKWLKMMIGVLVLSTAGWLVIEIKHITNGSLWLVCFIGAVAAADIGAYFVGRRFGKTKLAPKVSPGKTVEGLLGGLSLVALIYVPSLFYWFPPKAAALLSVTVLVTALVSVGGDLFESKLKRYVGLKDSSQILPGHGGMLDRIDSMLAGACFFSLGLWWLEYLG
jgi:phosphatidate cytidylyltransferase